MPAFEQRKATMGCPFALRLTEKWLVGVSMNTCVVSHGLETLKVFWVARISYVTTSSNMLSQTLIAPCSQITEHNFMYSQLYKIKWKITLWAVDHSARGSMKSAAKRDNYCELQDILSSNNLNANGVFGYSWRHVRLRVDTMKIQTNSSFITVDTWIHIVTNVVLRLNLFSPSSLTIESFLYSKVNLQSQFHYTTSDERDCPLNLSISLSGEKENNNDS